MVIIIRDIVTLSCPFSMCDNGCLETFMTSCKIHVTDRDTFVSLDRRVVWKPIPTHNLYQYYFIVDKIDINVYNVTVTILNLITWWAYCAHFKYFNRKAAELPAVFLFWKKNEFLWGVPSKCVFIASAVLQAMSLSGKF